MADAAISVVAQGGLKRLTHRAVDASAGVPTGTTSNYWNSRQALVDAMIARLEELDFAVWRATVPPEDLDELLGGLANAIAMLASEKPDLVRVRLALFLDHGDRFARAHGRVRGVLAGLLERHGVPDAATTAALIADLCDGVLLHSVTVRSEPIDVDGLARAFRALVGASATRGGL
ncbi:TetR/AcrR family transcriptional regulator [Epidermidibacterium keratini]